jgi:hypothetical protein
VDTFSPRSDFSGHPKPKKPLGSNVMVPQEHSGRRNPYYFNGSAVQEISHQALASVISELENFRSISMYFHRTSNSFWAVDFDATLMAVGDGLPHDVEEDSDCSDENDADEDEALTLDWTPLSFDWSLDPDRAQTIGLSSVALYEGKFQHIYCTRDDQRWPEMLLPMTYHPSDSRLRHASSCSAPFGSLNGNLAVLIALVAFTASPRDDHVKNALMRCIRGTSWRSPASSGGGCKSRSCYQDDVTEQSQG